MMRYRCWLLAVSLCLLAFLNVPAQTRKTVQKSTRTSSTQKAKTTSKTQTTRKSQTTKKTKKSKTATPQPTVKGLQSQRQKIQQQI